MIFIFFKKNKLFLLKTRLLQLDLKDEFIILATDGFWVNNIEKKSKIKLKIKNKFFLVLIENNLKQ